MNNNKPIYKNLEFVYDNPDYYVIISFAMYYDTYIPERSIIFQMEPYVYDLTKNWGIHAWPKEWSDPNVKEYLHVRKHSEHLNVAQWMFTEPKEINLKRKDKFIAIISEKLMDSGHINRVEFIKYIEFLGYDIIDIYGTANHHNFRNYKGTLDNKIIQTEYKYVFSVENNKEYNYATEKIWESFISCSLCFYDGCPNLSDYINSLAYVAIKCSNKELTLNAMIKAIDNDLWSQRLPYIIEAKDKTVNEYGFFEVVYNILK